jgi:hypothetical protein
MFKNFIILSLIILAVILISVPNRIKTIERGEIENNNLSSEENEWFVGDWGENCEVVCQKLELTCLMDKISLNDGSDCRICRQFFGEMQPCRSPKNPGCNAGAPFFGINEVCNCRPDDMLANCQAKSDNWRRLCVCG